MSKVERLKSLGFIETDNSALMKLTTTCYLLNYNWEMKYITVKDLVKEGYWFSCGMSVEEIGAFIKFLNMLYV